MRKEVDPEDLVPIGEAAHAAGVATSTVYRWREAGLITIYKRRSRTLILRSELERLLQPIQVRSGGNAAIRRPRTSMRRRPPTAP